MCRIKVAGSLKGMSRIYKSWCGGEPTKTYARMKAARPAAATRTTELVRDPAPLMKLVALGVGVVSATVALLVGTMTPLGEMIGTTVLVTRVTDGATGVTDGAMKVTGKEDAGRVTTGVELV
jgi:hypothetical protein